MFYKLTEGTKYYKQFWSNFCLSAFYSIPKRIESYRIAKNLLWHKLGCSPQEHMWMHNMQIRLKWFSHQAWRFHQSAHHMSSGACRSRHMERLLQLASGVDHWGGGQEAARQAPRLTWLGNLTRRRLPRARSSGKSGPPLRGWEAATELRGFVDVTWPRSAFYITTTHDQSSMNNVAHYLKKDCH